MIYVILLLFVILFNLLVISCSCNHCFVIFDGIWIIKMHEHTHTNRLLFHLKNHPSKFCECEISIETVKPIWFFALSLYIFYITIYLVLSKRKLSVVFMLEATEGRFVALSCYCFANCIVCCFDITKVNWFLPKLYQNISLLIKWKVEELFLDTLNWKIVTWKC